MAPEDLNHQVVQRQLERILSTPAFARNERQSRFLRFVVERGLAGKDIELKESVIGVEVFGRLPDYDPKLDSIVRTEASRLRSRLTEYYASEGRLDPVIIELPKGGYTVVFRRTERDSNPQKKHSSWLWATVVSVLLLISAALAWWTVKRQAGPISIAVLPFENLGHDQADDYFVDGLTSEIIQNLSSTAGLSVRSQTSSFALRAKSIDVRDAGRQLGVDYVVEGSVFRSEKRLRTTVELVRVGDDSPTWTGSFDRELTDVFALRDEVSNGVVNSLRLRLGVRRRYENSVEAYDSYLRAEGVLYGSLPQGMGASIRLFEEAIAKDSTFAPAYAGLAVSYANKASFSAESQIDTVEDLTHVMPAAEKAIQLDPLLPEAHHALGLAYARQARWQDAERSFQRALELDPKRAETHIDFAGSVLLPLGRTEDAIQQDRAAAKTDPFSTSVLRELIFDLLADGRFDEAAEQAQELPNDLEMKAQFLGRARLGQGRIDEAIKILTEDPNPNKGFLGYAYARSGRRADAEKLASEFEQPSRFNSPQVLALIYAGLGDKDRVIEALDSLGSARGPIRLGQYLNYPELSLLRGDSRLKSLREKFGLPEH